MIDHVSASSAARPMLSQTAEYALRAALYLADEPDRIARVGELAQTLKVPQNYLSKTLHQLARAGVLTSTRGMRGGFRLARDPATIYLAEVVSPFERLGGPRECLLGRPACSETNPCAAHHRWKAVAEATNSFFRQTTLHDLVHGNAAQPAPRRRPRAGT